MNILHMKYAVEIARVGSLSQAAQNLILAQPNLSRSIKELESELSTKKSSLKRIGVFDQESYTNLKAEITSLENKLSDLRNATDICPTCGQPINSPEHIAKRDEEIKTLSSTLETKRAEFEQKSALKKVYDDALAFNQKTKDECTELEKQIASLTSEKEKALLENSANQKSTENAISVLSEKYATQRVHVQELISSIEKNISQLEEGEVKLNNLSF